jgi:flagellar hook-length control protein FliK
LRQLPLGEHVLSLSVTPETFGPVRVVAHITPEGVSVQLFGASEASREALRVALVDLRRDLAATGLGASLDVGADSGADHGTGESARDRAGASARLATLSTAAAPAAPSTPASSFLPGTRPGGVDLIL